MIERLAEAEGGLAKERPRSERTKRAKRARFLRVMDKIENALPPKPDVIPAYFELQATTMRLFGGDSHSQPTLRSVSVAVVETQMICTRRPCVFQCIS